MSDMQQNTWFPRDFAYQLAKGSPPWPVKIIDFVLHKRFRNPSLQGEEADQSIVISSIRRRISVGAVRVQVCSLVGRLNKLGPGMKSAAGRRREAIEMEYNWRLEQSTLSNFKKTGQKHPSHGFSKA